MRSISFGVLACLFIASASDIAVGGDDLAASVVEIRVTHRHANPTSPWAPMPASDARGSGVVIDGDRILTCAHLVAYATEILVGSEQLPRRAPAHVEYASLGIDLAVLRVDEPGFFDTHAPVSLRTVPPTAGEAVTVCGFPTGGNSLSMTEGIVSRVEYRKIYCRTDGFRIQVDAAINLGNSGGPAFVNDQVVGIVSSRMSEAENIGYLVAAEEVEIFLEDVADGRYDGKPWLPISVLPAENPAQREWLRLPSETTGVVVSRPHPWNPEYPVRENDVITAIGGRQIDEQGLARADDGTLVKFQGMTQRLSRDNQVDLTIWRDGRSIELSVPLEQERRDLLPHEDGVTRPSYIIYGPLVLSPMTAHFAGALTRDDRFARLMAGVRSPIVTRQSDHQRQPGEQLVALVCPPLSHRSSRGMPPMYGLIIESVNGEPVRNFEHLVELLRDLDDEFAVFRFAGDRFGSAVVRATDVEDVTDEILRDHGIRDRMSPDAQAIWDDTASE